MSWSAFPFTDFTATKLRPALVLHENAYDVVVGFISSKVTAPTSQADILLLQEDSGFAASG